MANQRKEGQTLVAFPLDDAFLAEVDKARGELNRSAFVREALYRYLRERGVDLPPSIKAAPDRAGKGGRKTQPSVETAMLNDQVHPDPAPMKEGTKYPKRPPAKKRKTKE